MGGLDALLSVLRILLRVRLLGSGSVGCAFSTEWESICCARFARFRARLRAAALRHSSSQYRADAFFPDGRGSPHAAHFMLAL